nr:hypothetical protein OG781_00985 [Streptomyces sp. NBC_00830]WTB35749.1 hypothetical protein OG781_45595 [Streptomyces sp. NBC_00830]
MVRVLSLADDDVARAVDWYADLLGAVETGRECLLDGQVIGAELTVGDHVLILDAWSWTTALPDDSAPLPIERADAGTLVARMRRHGARVETPADGHGVLLSDPLGQRWLIRPARRDTP